jgi:hypothetical protein
MAIFDQLLNLTPDQNQGLLAAAAQILQASGPSRTPVSFGQALGSGLQAFQQSTNDAEQRKQQREQQALNARLLGLKIQDSESDLANQAATRQRAADLQQFYRDRAAGSPNAAALVPDGQTANLAPTVENAAGIIRPSAQAFSPSSLFSDRLREAQALRAAGFGPEADAAEAAALKFQPKVKDLKEVQVNGRTQYLPIFENGERGDPIPYDAAVKLAFQNAGGQTYGLNPITGERVVSIQNTATPGELLTNQRLREQNAIASQGKVANVSTDLRKEFDQLPEVKNYKQALPAYTSIVDASKRNTPQADINLVYGIAKLYDPNSVVREGEYNTVANSPNVPERIKGIIQYVSGGGRLTEAVKKQIIAEAQGRINSYEQEYTAARQNYSDIATRSGGDATLLFPSNFKPAAERTAPTAKKISLSDIAATARASGRTTAEVTAAAKAKGYTIGD